MWLVARRRRVVTAQITPFEGCVESCSASWAGFGLPACRVLPAAFRIHAGEPRLSVRRSAGMTEAPWHYLLFIGRNREACIDVLGPDAFKLRAEQIVDRLYAAGYTPDVFNPSRGPHPAPGVTTRIEYEGCTYLITVDEEAGAMTVQDAVADLYCMDE